jgi:hypothetical protein
METTYRDFILIYLIMHLSLRKQNMRLYTFRCISERRVYTVLEMELR